MKNWPMFLMVVCCSQSLVAMSDLDRELSSGKIWRHEVSDDDIADTTCFFPLSPIPSSNGKRIGRSYRGHGKWKRDFPLPAGSNVYSMANCEVLSRSDNPKSACGYGLQLGCDIKKFPVTVRYCHLAKPALKKSMFLAGELIGLSGNTGKSTGPHLHVQFEPDVAIEGVDSPESAWTAFNCFEDPKRM